VTRDRLLHHSTVFSIQGEGYRLKDKRRAGLIHLPAGGVGGLEVGARRRGLNRCGARQV
jgi:hypothetical protein